MEWLILLLKQASARLASTGLIALSRRLSLGHRLQLLLPSLRFYKRKLKAQLKDMPFIYRGLEAEVASDYVDVELLGIDLETLQTKEISAVSLGTDERLRASKRVLFLGNAGVGKTTFQRYAILQLLAGNDRFFHKNERLVPVYIPLKAVDNSSPAPIMSYLLARHPLFSRSDGIKRLRKYSSDRRLFLCLDGYDEISFLTEERNHVQDELALVLDWRTKRESGSELLAQYAWFYAAIRDCRVWLSSRREFFERNPVPQESLRRRRLEDLTALELKGVGNNRSQLARKIFEKYKRYSAPARDLLSEEYFLYSIDETLDDEIQTLSRNPLFLTVMCYLYAEAALKCGQVSVDWLQRVEDLIEACVSLLLNDLDEQKARDLPMAQRLGLLRRRNEYPELKLLFLECFAGRLFTERVAVFDLQYIKSELRRFIRVGQPEEVRRRIERDLETDVAIRPNVALQLVYCGVFVLVAYDARGAIYDFPHRRFREVLASKYFADPDALHQDSRQSKVAAVC